jgi:hypothetical protein
MELKEPLLETVTELKLIAEKLLTEAGSLVPQMALDHLTLLELDLFQAGTLRMLKELERMAQQALMSLATKTSNLAPITTSLSQIWLVSGDLILPQCQSLEVEKLKKTA